ncbi:LAO/AO transport system kinase [Parafrankia irregularis]|uniref:LAO/AO transport system kinase n=1 Tax=Parafrankia irregularis TaxID=795642 RepID=A0A0S4R051_9ACTN|nr:MULTISPECIES: methylmalonyl Co-A mutase-associated GTPase MeaB [Parafrankia]MBE3205328.1 methylmalonyl Co-A mutase-associated GTPase MeaB [Parafrankia sp. CH37]CUU60750.1 LAO/AO transport system kinase [Parafrankia irregularis]
MSAGSVRAARAAWADPAELTAAALAGDRRAVARLISLVEDSSAALREVSALLAPHTGRARVIGLTGAPGVGKSTSTSGLVGAYRAAGLRVGVLAIDPSSPFTGGALLGDRVRMVEHASDPDVFVRSLATRGNLGGLSWATPQALRVLDAAGFDVVLVETVGVGQAEVDVAALADTTLVLLAPGMGDGIQAAKAGIMEIADILVVNKADRPGADHTYRDVVTAVRMAGRPRESIADTTFAGAGAGADGGATGAGGGLEDWHPDVIRVAAVSGEGLPELVAAIERHQTWLRASGVLRRRRLRRAGEEISQIALAGLRARLGRLDDGQRLAELARQVTDGQLDPYTAADTLLAGVAG